MALSLAYDESTRGSLVARLYRSTFQDSLDKSIGTFSETVENLYIANPKGVARDLKNWAEEFLREGILDGAIAINDEKANANLARKARDNISMVAALLVVADYQGKLDGLSLNGQLPNLIQYIPLFERYRQNLTLNTRWSNCSPYEMKSTLKKASQLLENVKGILSSRYSELRIIDNYIYNSVN